MVQKVFVTAKNTARFACPKCKKSRTIDLERAHKLKNAMRVQVKCSCGHRYPVIIERRLHFRKPVNFPGTYRLQRQGRLVGGGVMTVINLSRSGMRLRINDRSNFETDDRLIVEFHLDDLQRTPIRKEVIVKYADKNELGTAFNAFDPSNAGDKAIGFYLFE